MSEKEGEGEVGEDSEGDEEKRRAKGLILGPGEVEDCWVVSEPVLEG